MGSITHYSHFFLLGYLPGALALPLNTCHYCHCHYLTEQFFVCHKVAILLLLRYSFLCHVQWYFWKKIFVCSASRYYLSLAPRKTILFVLCNMFSLLSWSCKTISLSTLNNGISCDKCTTFSRPTCILLFSCAPIFVCACHAPTYLAHCIFFNLSFSYFRSVIDMFRTFMSCAIDTALFSFYAW